MTIDQAIEWAGRGEPPQVYIAGHPVRTKRALELLADEVIRLQEAAYDACWLIQLGAHIMDTSQVSRWEGCRGLVESLNLDCSNCAQLVECVLIRKVEAEL